MNKFTSRTKNWLLLIGYVALIYITLPLMPRMTAFFSSLFGRNFGTIVNSLLIAILIIIIVVMFRYGPGWKNPIFYIGAAALFTAYSAILFFATPIIAEKMHLLEYGFLSYLALRALKGVTLPKKQYLYAFLIVIITGYLDELLQGVTPGRFYQTKDVILNIISGILGLFIIILLKRQAT